MMTAGKLEFLSKKLKLSFQMFFLNLNCQAKKILSLLKMERNKQLLLSRLFGSFRNFLFQSIAVESDDQKPDVSNRKKSLAWKFFIRLDLRTAKCRSDIRPPCGLFLTEANDNFEQF